MGAELNFNYYSKLGVSSLGGEFRNEQLLSNVLGEPLDYSVKVPNEVNAFFDKFIYRNNINIFLDHTFSADRFSASAGMLACWNTDYGLNYYPGVDLSYKLFDNVRLYGSYNRTLRFPSFTELYYKDPVSLGNSKLRPEEAQSFEAGFKFINKYLKSHISIFTKNASNVIDWIKVPGDSLWRSANLTQVNSYGFETSIKLDFYQFLQRNYFINSLTLSYSYIENQKNHPGFISKYALDVLKHKLDISIDHNILDGFGASWYISFQDRSGEYLEFNTNKIIQYPPFWLTNAKIYWNYKKLYAYVQISNLFNVSYQDNANVILPGRWLLFGININLNY
jgi:iron complex outermembrane receptor protein